MHPKASDIYAPTEQEYRAVLAAMPNLAILAKSDHVQHVGVRLRQLIDALDISYVQAAHEMGVTKSQLGNWMRGDSYPAPYQLYLFCRRRGLTFDWVYLGDPAGLPYQVATRLLQGEQAPEETSGAGSQASEKVGTK